MAVTGFVEYRRKVRHEQWPRRARTNLVGVGVCKGRRYAIVCTAAAKDNPPPSVYIKFIVQAAMYWLLLFASTSSSGGRRRFA